VDAIRIRHCRLRVLRHGGWSWGADPRQLVERVKQKLPAWLMQMLAEQLAEFPSDITIQQLRLRIPLQLSELRDLSSYDPAGAEARLETSFSQRVRDQLAAALRDIPRLQPAVPERPALSATAAAREALSPTAVLDMMIAWQNANELPRMLATVDVATLRVWARAVLDERAQVTCVAAMAVQETAQRAAGIELLLADTLTTTRTLAPELASFIAELAAPRSESAAIASERMKQENSEAGRASPAPTIARPDAAETQTTRPELRRALPARQLRREPVAIESVLPFVVTGILARQKYLDGLTAALACTDLLDQAACFAAALVYKLSAPPNRGWDRGVATRRLAAAMCGLDQPPTNPEMDRFLRGLSTASKTLDASLWPASRAARRQPGILVEKLDAQTWAALDIASAQPLGWATSCAELLRLDDLLPGRLWWLAPGAADCGFAEAMQARGLRGVAQGSRPRAAGWLSAGHSLSTNEPTLRRHGGWLRKTFDEAHGILTSTHAELIELRPLVLPARGPTRTVAEFSITLAVCSALGEIADTLWRGREPAHPLLAMQRFADLSGTVSVEEGRVLVRPALGRRFMDLSQHGLLRDITAVPWWPGRRVEFAGP
jgi:hypothetical protein